MLYFGATSERLRTNPAQPLQAQLIAIKPSAAQSR